MSASPRRGGYPLASRIRKGRAGEVLSRVGLSPRDKRTVTDAMAVVDERWGTSDACDRPVFVFASGWRSGSTLLQRLVISSGEVFLWGEPYAHCDLVRSLAETLRPISTVWPREEDVWSSKPLGEGDLTASWIATLSPAAETLVDAHRALLRTMLAPPACMEGARWGLKEVRLGSDDASYLKWLYPRAQFVFLHRNPYDQWRSYGRWRNWFDRWPRQRVSTPGRFGAVWRRLTAGFVEHAEELGALVVRYDRLVSDPSTVAGLDNYLGITVDTSVLEHRVGSARGPDRPVPSVAHRQLRQLQRHVEPLASQLGYRP